MKKDIIEQLNKLEKDNNKKIITYALITNCGIAAIGRDDVLLTLLALYVKELEKYIDIENILKAIALGLIYKGKEI